MIDLTPDQFEKIMEIFDTYLPGREVKVYGSRAEGHSKAYSDLDIAVMGPDPVDLGTLATLKDAFAESDLPFRVEILQWCQTDPEFKRVIEPQLRPLKLN